jgi:hypothetical protein
MDQRGIVTILLPLATFNANYYQNVAYIYHVHAETN